MQLRQIKIGATVAMVLTILAVVRWNNEVAAPRVAASRPAQPAPAAPAARPAPQVSTMAAAAEPPLAEQVDRLVATHDPAKAFDAYILLRDCADFNRDHDRLIYDVAEVIKKHKVMPYRGMTGSEKEHDARLCTSMTERMRVSRLDYLAIAARTGMSRAVVEMANEGPFGDRTALRTRPDDPLVREWKAEVMDLLIRNAEDGDRLTLGYLWPLALKGDELIGKNPALAYRYGVADGLFYRDIFGPDFDLAKLYAPDGEFMQSIEGLSAQQRVEETAAAKRIADRERARRRREAKQH
jgi:hypothetical protein